MARPSVTKNKNDFEYFKNQQGLNTRGSIYNIIDGQCRENKNVKYTKLGGYTNRGGQANVNATVISGSPEIKYGKEFRRFPISGSSFAKKIGWGADGKVYDFSTNPPTAVLTGLTASAMPDACVAHGWLCQVNGVDEPKKWDGAAWQKWGIDAPGSAPTVAAGAAGNPLGTYEFAVAYGRQPNDIDPGHFSSLGVFSADVTATNQKIDLTNIPISTDPQVNQRRLAVLVDGEWYFFKDINDNTTTTATYDFLDSDAVTFEKARFDRDPPPTDLIYVEFHENIVYGTNGRQLYWTSLDEFESWSSDPIEGRVSNAFETGDGTRITGLRSFVGLVVTKERCFYVRTGDDVNYAIEKKPDSRGCIARNSMVVNDRLLYMYSHEGFCAFDNNSSYLVSNNIHNLLFSPGTDKILYSPDSVKITAANYTTNEHQTIIFSIPTSAAESTKALVYFPEFKTPDVTDPTNSRIVGAWSTWENLNARFLFTTLSTSGDFSDGLYQCGNAGRMIQLDTGTDDLGAAIQCVYHDADHAFGGRLNKKRLRDAYFAIYSPNSFLPPPTPPTVEWYVNGGPSGIVRNLNFVLNGDVFDTAIFDTSHFAAEGLLTAFIAYTPNPFSTLTPRISWNVASAADVIVWLGWTMRIIPAGYRRGS